MSVANSRRCNIALILVLFLLLKFAHVFFSNFRLYLLFVRAVASRLDGFSVCYILFVRPRLVDILFRVIVKAVKVYSNQLDKFAEFFIGVIHVKILIIG